MTYITPIIIESAGTGGRDTLIQEITVGAGGIATLEFTSIPASYIHLYLEWMATVEASGDWLEMYFNNDTGANYSRGSMNPAGNQTGTATTSIYVGYTPSVNADGVAARATGVIDIPWYSQTSYNKTAYGICAPGKPNSGGVTHVTFSGAWNNSAAINRISFFRLANDIAQGSVFRLYGRN